MADESASLDKVANLLGLLVTKDMSKGEKVLTLASCGFSTKDIASLTGSAENAVRAALSTARKKATDKAGKAD